MRYSNKGKIQNIVWLDAIATVKYTEIARRLNKASNVIMAEILTKAIQDICQACNCPKIICCCKYLTCKQCNKQFISNQGYDERFCSNECAKAWWSS